MHGGKSRGEARNQRNRRHGAYSQFVVTEEERAILDGMARELGQLDSELSVLRWRLAMTIRAQQAWEQEHTPEDLVVVEETANSIPLPLAAPADAPAAPEETEGLGGMHLAEVKDTRSGAFPGLTVVRKRPDFDGLIQRLTAAIRRLEESRMRLLEGGELRGRLDELFRRLDQVKQGEGTVDTPEAGGDAASDGQPGGGQEPDR